MVATAQGECMFPERCMALGRDGDFTTIAHHLLHYRTVIEQIGPEDDVLDVGCGCGLASRFYRLQTEGRVVAVDRPPSIAIARSLYYAPGVEYVDLDFTEGPLPAGEFDVAVLTEVYEHLEEALGRKVIREISDRLRPDGRLFMSVPLLSRGPEQAAERFRYHVRDFADEAAVLTEVAEGLAPGQTVGLVFMKEITGSMVGTKGGEAGCE